MCAITGTRPFNISGNIVPFTNFAKSDNGIFIIFFIEINAQKIASFVLQHRINTDDISLILILTCQMLKNILVC